MSRFKGLRRVSGVAAAAALIVACDAADTPPVGDAQSDDAAVPAVQGAPDPVSEPVPAQATHINVTLSEWSVALDLETAAAGVITMTVTNTGQYAHALEFEGGHWQAEPLLPGESAFLEVRLDPGSYTLSCPVVDEHGAHRDQGMTAVLTVQ